MERIKGSPPQAMQKGAISIGWRTMETRLEAWRGVNSLSLPWSQQSHNAPSQRPNVELHLATRGLKCHKEISGSTSPTARVTTHKNEVECLSCRTVPDSQRCASVKNRHGVYTYLLE